MTTLLLLALAALGPAMTVDQGRLKPTDQPTFQTVTVAVSDDWTFKPTALIIGDLVTISHDGHGAAVSREQNRT